MSAEEFSGVEFSIEPVRGVRSFAVDSLGRLTGVIHKDVWQPGENVAACHRDTSDFDAYMASIQASISMMASVQPYASGGYIPSPIARSGWINSLTRGKPAKVEVEPEAPKPTPKPAHSMADCQCGFYGYFDGSNDYRTDARVGAVIEGYGETVLGTRGFRSQKARIVALCVIPGNSGPSTSLAIAMAARPDAKTKPTLTERLAAAVCRNYADIPQFEDFAAMVATYPPDLARVPGPETDPDFWTRVAP